MLKTFACLQFCQIQLLRNWNSVWNISNVRAQKKCPSRTRLSSSERSLRGRVRVELCLGQNLQSAVSSTQTSIQLWATLIALLCLSFSPWNIKHVRLHRFQSQRERRAVPRKKIITDKSWNGKWKEWFVSLLRGNNGLRWSPARPSPQPKPQPTHWKRQKHQYVCGCGVMFYSVCFNPYVSSRSCSDWRLKSSDCCTFHQQSSLSFLLLKYHVSMYVCIWACRRLKRCLELKSQPDSFHKKKKAKIWKPLNILMRLQDIFQPCWW